MPNSLQIYQKKSQFLAEGPTLLSRFITNRGAFDLG